eukprot:COSAG02_NODE_2191_length_9562_cov_35.619888_6_plen_656_part_00
MDAPASNAAAQRTGSHLEGNSCCKNFCVILQCEPAWSRKPLSACCFCVGPLRWGGFLAAATTAVISICLMLPVFLVLRAKTFFNDETIEEYAALPFSVLLLRHLYNAFLLWTLLTGVCAIAALRAIKRNEVAAPKQCTCRSPPPLLLSRLLRLGAYLFSFAFLFTSRHSHNVCLNYAVREEVAAYRDACACEVNTTWLDITIPDGRCAPQNYVLCEPPESDALQARDYSLHQQCTACGLDSEIHRFNVDSDDHPEFEHAACTFAACHEIGCHPKMHTCPPDKTDYEHSLLGPQGQPLHHMSSWVSAQANSDHCHYDDDGRLTSLQFVPDTDSSSPMLDEYLESGVLVLVENGQSMQDSLTALSDGSVRGSLNVSLGDEDVAEALSMADGVSVETGSCRLDVKTAMQAVEQSRESCSIIVTAWSLMFCLIGFVTCLHFARVLYSLALIEKPSAAPVARPVAGTTPGASPRENSPAGDGDENDAAGVETQAPWRAAWREAKKRPAKHRKGTSGIIATGHVQLEDIEMSSVSMSAAGGGSQRPGTPPGRGEDEDTAASDRVRGEQEQESTEWDVPSTSSPSRVRSVDASVFDVDSSGVAVSSPTPSLRQGQAQRSPATMSAAEDDDFHPRINDFNPRQAETPQDRIAAAISSAQIERP